MNKILCASLLLLSFGLAGQAPASERGATLASFLGTAIANQAIVNANNAPVLVQRTALFGSVPTVEERPTPPPGLYPYPVRVVPVGQSPDQR